MATKVEKVARNIHTIPAQRCPECYRHNGALYEVKLVSHYDTDGEAVASCDSRCMSCILAMEPQCWCSSCQCLMRFTPPQEFSDCYPGLFDAPNACPVCFETGTLMRVSYS